MQSMRSYRFPPEDLERHQNRKFREIVRFAFDKVPYYHRAMREGGLNPSDFTTGNDVRMLPMLNKAILLANPGEDFLARGVPVMLTRHTSGTTGPSVTFSRGPKTVQRSITMKLRTMWLSGVRPWEKSVFLPYFGTDVSNVAQLSGVRARRAKGGLSVLLSRPRDLVIGYKVLPIGPGNVDAISGLLVGYKPNILHARPSYLRRIAKVVKELEPSFGVDKIFSEGEMLTNGTRADLASTYGAEIFDSYGSSECSGLGGECRWHNGIHLFPDYFIFELLARDGYPAAPGERAELVVTSLEDDAMPLLRYRIGDFVISQEDGLCGCGSYFPRLERIDGRASDGMLTSEGDPILAGEVIEYIETHLGLRDFQLVQEGPSEMKLRALRIPTETVLLQLRKYLSGLTKAEVSIRIELWRSDEMPIKFRPVTRSGAKRVGERVKVN
ncbi:MAG TPA: hypothetical protein VIW22_08175 [Nitrososphaerales archaeon]